MIDKEISDMSNTENASHSPARKNHMDAVPHHDGIPTDSLQVHGPNKGLTRLEDRKERSRELMRVLVASKSLSDDIPIGGYRRTHVTENGRLIAIRISWCSLTDHICKRLRYTRSLILSDPRQILYLWTGRGILAVFLSMHRNCV